MSLDADKFSAAKLWLISAPPGPPTEESPRDLPYLAHALYAMVLVESTEVERATCDERWRVYVDPGWFASASVREIAEELAHLTWHLLNDHAARARDLGVDRTTAADWAQAADLALAAGLDPDHLRPARLPSPVDRRLPPGRSAEEYFAITSGLPVGSPANDGAPPDPAAGCGSGADGIPRAYEHPDDADVGGVAQLEALVIRTRVSIEYRAHARGRGRDPGKDLRTPAAPDEHRAPWPELLAAAVRRAVGWVAGRGEYSFARPSRRQGVVRGIILPGQRRRVPRVSFIVDTSGSVDDQLLARALAEIDGAIAAVGVPGTHVTIHSVDAAAHTVRRAVRAADAVLVGAGGTDLRIGLRAAELERPRPEVVIVLTDGDTPWPETPPPGIAVIVAVLGRVGGSPLPVTPPWAMRVECRLDE